MITTQLVIFDDDEELESIELLKRLLTSHNVGPELTSQTLISGQLQEIIKSSDTVTIKDYYMDLPKIYLNNMNTTLEDLDMIDEERVFRFKYISEGPFFFVETNVLKKNQLKLFLEFSYGRLFFMLLPKIFQLLNQYHNHTYMIFRINDSEVYKVLSISWLIIKAMKQVLLTLGSNNYENIARLDVKRAIHNLSNVASEKSIFPLIAERTRKATLHLKVLTNLNKTLKLRKELLWEIEDLCNSD